MKRSIRNVLGVLLLSMAIAVTQLPVEQMEAAGASSEFQMDGTTLVKYTGTASAVSVPAEVKRIGEEAFAENHTVQSVKLSSKLETIEYGAFRDCSNLKKIQIPDSVTEIGSGAFACCSSLNSVSIGDGVEKLGTGVFAGCTSLKGVKLGKKNGNFQMGKGVLYDKDMKKIYQYFPGYTDSVYNMPSTVEDIGVYAFWGCKNLETVVMNSELPSIAGYAFSNCTSLKEVQIPYSVKMIGAKAFEDCVGLTDVTLPPSVRTIHETAFDGCVNLTLTAEEEGVAGAYAREFNNREKAVQTEYEDIHSSEMMTPSEDLSEEEPKQEAEETPATEQEETGNVIGSTVVVGNQAVVFIDNTAVSREDMVRVFTPQEVTVSGNDSMEALPQEDKKGLHIPKYTYTQDGMIANQAYYKRKDVTSFSFPEGTREIGEFAFARSSLTSVTIPEGVTRIGYGAFYHCDNLNQVSLPSTIERIEPEAFARTGFIENWKKSGSGTFLTAGKGILLAYNGAQENVTIPEGVRIIAPGVFADNTMLKTVVLPDSLETIGEGAFEGCSSLEQVSGGANLLKLQDRAFAGCPIQTIRISDKVESIGLRAFDVTGTKGSNAPETVVFHGNIPKLSYEQTAQRLSNDAYRGRALEGICVAVIEKDIAIDALKDTVLDGTQYGFKGIIVSLNSDTSMTATVRGTTFTPEELAYYAIPETIEVYGRQYMLNGVEQLESMAACNTDTAYDADDTVLILNQVPDMETKQMRAELSGNTGAYYLKISREEESLKLLTKAYEAVYHTQPPASLKTFSISLVEEASGVLITRLGRQSIQITIPKPEGLGDGEVFLLTTDANGQLEQLPCRYEKESGLITFETSHFSPFGFYTRKTSLYAEGDVQNGQAVIGSYSAKDDSPDTGDLIHPKWFLACGLFFSAFALFFYRRKPHKLVK